MNRFDQLTRSGNRQALRFVKIPNYNAWTVILVNFCSLHFLNGEQYHPTRYTWKFFQFDAQSIKLFYTHIQKLFINLNGKIK